MTARDVFIELLDRLVDNIQPTPYGERYLRDEWLERFDQANVDALQAAPPDLDLPYEDVTDGPVAVGLPDDEQLVLVDTINARSTVLAGEAGTVAFALPLVILDLQQGRETLGQPPLLVQRVGIVGPADVLRKMGKLMRDACYGAANAVEHS